MLRGDLEERVDPEFVEVGGRAMSALVVGLVDRKQQRLSRRTQLVCDGLIAGDEALTAIDDEHNQIGGGYRALTVPDDELVQRILARAVQAPGIKQLEGRPAS